MQEKWDVDLIDGSYVFVIDLKPLVRCAKSLQRTQSWIAKQEHLGFAHWICRKLTVKNLDLYPLVFNVIQLDSFPPSACGFGKCGGIFQGNGEQANHAWWIWGVHNPFKRTNPKISLGSSGSCCIHRLGTEWATFFRGADPCFYSKVILTHVQTCSHSHLDPLKNTII